MLTHLDASGREAVGNVLRAMVSNPNPNAAPSPGPGSGSGSKSGSKSGSRAGPGSGALVVDKGEIGTAAGSENNSNDNNNSNDPTTTDLPLVIEEADGVVTMEGQGLEGGSPVSYSRTR